MRKKKLSIKELGLEECLRQIPHSPLRGLLGISGANWRRYPIIPLLCFVEIVDL